MLVSPTSTKTSANIMQGITLDRSLSGPLALSSGPSLSLEQERDSLKEKYEHLKILLNHFKHENLSQQRTKDGLENVTRLLQEARQENASLQKRNRSQETVIRTLQSRLVTNGLSGGIGIEETDLFTPGTSNQVFENLIKEVTRLRTLLHSASIEPEEVDRLRQEYQLSQETTEELKEQSEKLSKELSHYKELFSGSANEKDVKIAELSSLVQKMQADFQTRDVLCLSLSEETASLRNQLHEISVNCRQMALRLERSQSSVSDNCTTPKGPKETDIQGPEISGYEELHRKFTEVVLMNKRWQNYDQQRDKFVHDLQSRIEALTLQLQEAEKQKVTHEYQRKINGALSDAQRKIQQAEIDKKKLQDDLNFKNSEVEKYRREIANSVPSGQHFGDAEIVEALKAQIQICTEDFESERRDREKAQSQLSRLEAENQKLRSDLFKKQGMLYDTNESQLRPTYGSEHQHQDFYNDFNIPMENYHYPGNNDILAARGPRTQISDPGDTVVDGPSHDVPEETAPPGGDRPNMPDRELSPMESLNFPSLTEDEGVLSLGSNNSAKDVISPQSSNQSDPSNVLSCPKCHVGFKSDEHVKMMEHVMECCE